MSVAPIAPRPWPLRPLGRLLRSLRAAWPPRSRTGWEQIALRDQYGRLIRRFGVDAVARHVRAGRLARAVRARVRRGLI